VHSVGSGGSGNLDWNVAVRRLTSRCHCALSDGDADFKRNSFAHIYPDPDANPYLYVYTVSDPDLYRVTDIYTLSDPDAHFNADYDANPAETSQRSAERDLPTRVHDGTERAHCGEQ
jgi:hypothetical protein